MLQCKGVEVVEAEEASSDEEEEKMTKHSPASHPHIYGDIPNPPDGGCICFVLRTGFSSAQGKLVRMIEGSQEKVKGHEGETALLLLLLFFFAVASLSYVLYHGLRDENRSQYELEVEGSACRRTKEGREAAEGRVRGGNGDLAGIERICCRQSRLQSS